MDKTIKTFNLNTVTKIAQRQPYPYYLAVYTEGRLKGQYPSPEIQFVPEMKRMWDRGDLGSGKKTVELKDSKISDLIMQLRSHGKDPRFDNVSFYIVR